MRLINYRHHFACNSSSTHSCLLVGNAEGLHDIITSSLPGAYNWEVNTLVSKYEIMKYIAAQYSVNLTIAYPGMPKEYRQMLINGVFKQDFPDVDINNFDIDHQSLWYLPKDINTKAALPSIELMNDIINLAQKDNFVICTTNDNDETRPSVWNDEATMINAFEFMKNGIGNISDYVCLKDKNAGVWKYFNMRNGTKIRFSFEEVPYPKSSTPELVDLIVTNKCKNNCPWCYRDCTETGKEAHIKDVERYIIDLVQMNVFEIVIGGGDLLFYSYLEDLLSIIEYYKRTYNVVFSTTLFLNTKLMTDKVMDKMLDAKVRLIMETMDAVAFSVDNGVIIDTIKTRYFEYLKYGKQISFNIIPETMSKFGIKSCFDSAYSQWGKQTPLMLLGYKSTGRGKDYKEYRASYTNYEEHQDFSELKELINQYAFGDILLDTQFIKNFPEIEEIAREWMLTKEEGKYSCCIDATKNLMAPSSYSDFADWKKIKRNKGAAREKFYTNIQDIWQEF